MTATSQPGVALVVGVRLFGGRILGVAAGVVGLSDRDHVVEVEGLASVVLTPS